MSELPDQAKQLTSRAGGSPMSQLMALQMGRSWLPPDASREMTDEERAILAMAADAAARIDGATEAQITRDSGLSRMTVRKALGL